MRCFTLALVFAFAALGPAQAQIRIGQPSGFSGPVAAGVQENTEGATLYFDAVNARGGIHGQKIELLSVDDKFDPKLTAELGRKLVAEQGVLALFLNRGTPHAQALLPLLQEFKLPLVGPSTGAMLLHRPVNPYVFNVRATYQREAEKAVLHLSTMGLTRIGILQVDDTFGADAATGALKGFERTGLKPVFHHKFDRAKPDVAALVAAVLPADPQALVFIGSAGAVSDGTHALRAAGSRAQVVTLSNNASGGFIKQLGPHARGIIVTQIFPYERSLSAPMVNELAGLAKARGRGEITPAMLEGFAAAKVLVEGLRRAGPGPTPAKLMQALEGMKKVDIGGLEVSYSPDDHSGLDYADIAIIGPDGRFKR
ncbi:MAG: ABC transporter substrate-binding protein [Burkholderiales bacterium]|nr:ABC transporter substrate-binding protein [Burkholderiales bacterium]